MTERCRSVEPLLSAWLDLSLSRAERSTVSSHLPRCARCRAELASLRRTVTMIRSAPTRGLPTDLRSTLLATAGATAGFEHRPPARLSLPRAAATLLALLCALSASAALLSGEDPPGPRVPAPTGVYVISPATPAPTPVFIDSE